MRLTKKEIFFLLIISLLGVLGGFVPGVGLILTGVMVIGFLIQVFVVSAKQTASCRGIENNNFLLILSILLLFAAGLNFKLEILPILASYFLMSASFLILGYSSIKTEKFLVLANRSCIHGPAARKLGLFSFGLGIFILILSIIWFIYSELIY